MPFHQPHAVTPKPKAITKPMIHLRWNRTMTKFSMLWVSSMTGGYINRTNLSSTPYKTGKPSHDVQSQPSSDDPRN